MVDSNHCHICDHRQSAAKVARDLSLLAATKPRSKEAPLLIKAAELLNVCAVKPTDPCPYSPR
jgi:hypothetical protein